MNWSREERLYDELIANARTILANLAMSNAEHSDAEEVMYGLIEEWEYLREIAREAMLNEKST